MAMLCRAMQRETSIPVTGLCHSVQGTAEMLADWIGAPYDEITYACAGINHQAWYLEVRVERQGRLPADPQGGHRKAGDLQRGAWSATRCSWHLGYYVTESSGHNSEYNWWFRKRPDLIEKYCTHGTGWNPGEYAYILKEYQNTRSDLEGRGRASGSPRRRPIDLERGHEYAAYIINACMGGEPFQFNGNVPNTGLITNLPAGRLRRGAGAASTRPASTPSTSARCRRSAPLLTSAQRRDRGDGRRGRADRRPDAWSTRPSATTR